MPLSPVATSHSGGLTAPGLEEDVRVGVHNNSMRNVAVLKRFASLRKRHQVVALQSLGSRQSSWPSFTVGLLNRPKLNSVARASARAVPQPTTYRTLTGPFQNFEGIATAW